MSILYSSHLRAGCLPELSIGLYLEKGTARRVLPAVLQLLLVICVIFTPIAVCAAKGTGDVAPLIRNFSADEIGTASKVLCLLETPEGVLLAGADRLLIYDGATWTQAKMENSAEIRSLCLQGGRIWAGGINEVGYFEKNSNGAYIYTSVTSQLGNDFYGVVFNIYNMGDSMVLVANRKVVQLSLKPGVPARISDYPNDTKLRAYVLDATLYVNQKSGAESKTWVLKNGVFELMASPLGGERQNYAPLGWIGRHLISGVDWNLYARNFDTGEERCIYADQGDLFRAQLNWSTICSNDRIYIGTRSGGYFVFDLDGNAQQVSKAQGLISDTCNAIIPSQAGGIWVATDEGICFVQEQSQAGWIPLPSETKTIFGNREDLYISHTQSALHLSQGRKTEIPNLLRAAWARIDDDIYAVSMGALYKAKAGTDQFTEIAGLEGLRLSSIVGVQGVGQTLYGATTSPAGVRGLMRLDMKSGQKTVYELTQGFVYYLQDKSGQIWVNTQAGNIMMIDEAFSRGSEQLAMRKRCRLTLHEGQPLALVNDSGFLTMKGEKVRGTENVTGALGTECAEGPAWIYGRSDDMLRVGVVAGDGDGLVWQRKNIPGLKRFKNVAALYRSGNDLWVGGETGVIHVDVSKLSGPDFTLPEMEIFLRDSQTKEQRALPAGSKVLALTNAEQEIALRLKTRVWGLLEPTQYESRLLPLEDEWTLHKYGEVIARKNLPTGRYTLQLRVHHLGETGPVTAIQVFRPLPWYFSHVGITLFSIVGCLLFYGAVKLRTRQITARNRELEKKIVERTQELARANAAKSEFLAAMSHEIRNPMNGVIGIVKILQEAKLGAREKYYLTTLHRCAEQLRTTVDDVLDFSKIEAGTITLHPDTFDLAEAINATIAAIDLSGDRLELASWAGQRPTVTGDQGKFCQILTNYFSNALKYGVPPSASIDVYVLNEGPQRCRVTVAVKNTGPDIPPHEQATLFETFTRGEYARRGRIGGSGLGLSICKKYAEAMGGAVNVTSAAGLTVFQVIIPFEIAHVRRHVDQDAAAPRSLNARALAIEDEDYNRLVLGNILAKLGYKVDWACDGKTALQLAQQNGYDLILTDLMLPDTDGGTLTREILLQSEEPKPPIFAVTAYSTKEKEDECLQAGMAGFISKPITVEKLEAAIKGWASKHRASAKPFVEPSAPTANVTVAQLARLGPLEVILPDFIRKIQNEWTGIDRMLEDRECTPAANAAHKLISAMLLVEADVLSDQLRLLESRLRDGALESEIEKVRSVCRDEVANVDQALQAALKRHQRLSADRKQT